MAGNKKIFDLPLRTGITADDRLVIADSGNTTTYSVKVSDLQDGTGVNSLESLTGDITFSGTNIDISTSGQTIILSGSTGGGGAAGLVAAPGTNSYKSVNIPDVDVVGDNTFYIGNNVNAADGITSTGGSNLLIGNGNITNGSGNAVFGASPSACSITTSGGYGGNIVLQSGKIVGVGFRGGGVYHAHDCNYQGGEASVMMGGYFTDMNGTRNFVACNQSYSDYSGNHNVAISNDQDNDITGSYNVALSNLHQSDIVGNHNARIAGGTGDITASYSGVFVGDGNNITHDYSAIIGGSGLTSNYAYEVQVPNLTIANYASLNYADDTAAAAGGIVLGQVYHNNGDLRVRIT